MAHIGVLFIYYNYVIQMVAKEDFYGQTRTNLLFYWSPPSACWGGRSPLAAGTETSDSLLEQGVRYFGVGGALGFDTLVAEKLLELRGKYPQIRVILVRPFRGYQSRWTAAQQARAARIESRVDKVVYCCDTPSREAFLARDRHLVDGSAYCIGYCTRATGGTAYKQGLQIWNVALV